MPHFTPSHFILFSYTVSYITIKNSKYTLSYISSHHIILHYALLHSTVFYYNPLRCITFRNTAYTCPHTHSYTHIRENVETFLTLNVLSKTWLETHSFEFFYRVEQNWSTTAIYVLICEENMLNKIKINWLASIFIEERRLRTVKTFLFTRCVKQIHLLVALSLPIVSFVFDNTNIHTHVYIYVCMCV